MSQFFDVIASFPYESLMSFEIGQRNVTRRLHVYLLSSVNRFCG